MTPGQHVLDTARLTLRAFTEDDAAFVARITNEPSFLANIGDRGVRDHDTAIRYLRDGPFAMYDKHGFGLWRIERREDGAVIGMCGLLKRDALEEPDIGYALLPGYAGAGYASEAAGATVAWGESSRGLERIAAIVSPHNVASVRVLEKLGFGFEHRLRLADDADEVMYFLRRSKPA